MDGGAAAAADLQQGDAIVGVGATTGQFVDLSGRGLDEAVQLIKGPPGSEVRLRVRRTSESGEESFHEINVTREPLFFPENQ